MERAQITKLTEYAKANPNVDKRISATVHRKDFANAADMVAAYYRKLMDAQNAGLSDNYIALDPVTCEKKFKRIK